MTHEKLYRVGSIWTLALAAFLALAAAGCQSRSEATETAAPSVEQKAPSSPADTAADDGAEKDAALRAEAARLAEKERELAAREAALAEREAQERERQLAAREAAVAARERQERERQAAAREAARQAEAEAARQREEDARVATADAETPAAETQAAEDESIRDAVPEEPPRRAIEVTVPAGTELEVELQDEVSSAVSLPGDRFHTRVVRDVVVDGLVAIPVGARVSGTVTEAVPTKKIGGKARLSLELDHLQLPSGESLPIRTSFADEGRSEAKKDAATIGGAAAGGAVLGRILDRKHKGKGTVLGAIVGAAVGTAIASQTPGEEVVLAEGTVIGLRLEEPLRMLVEQ